MRKHLAVTALLAVLLAGETAGIAKDKKDEASPAAKAARDFDKNPYPSTYKPYPGRPTLITGATVFDGKGGRIERGNVLLRDGKVAAVAGSLTDMDLPEGTVRIDGFVGPAHVSTVIGTKPYEPFAAGYRKPVVISGLEPLDVMQSILMLVRQMNEGRAEVENQYIRAVTREGPRQAPARGPVRPAVSFRMRAR